MNGKTGFLTVALMVIIMLSISSVVASDDVQDKSGLKASFNNDTIKSDQMDAELISNQEKLSLDGDETPALAGSHIVDGNDFASIRNAIESAKDGDTICLGGKTYKGTGEAIYVDKPVTIIGGFSDDDNVLSTLDAQKLSRIMLITTDNVTLKGIKFINGNVPDTGVHNKDNGGAIDARNQNNVTAVNCVFCNNRAGNYGGATYDCSAVNCIFYDNTANLGGAMCYGSAVNCTLNNNSAWRGGAKGFGSAVDCTFNNNSADDMGGAVWGGDQVNCVFNNNKATNTGGAIYYGHADGCIFNNNYAKWGGAMVGTTCVNCVSNNNSASDRGGAMDGGHAVNCVFNHNHAPNGGAMYDGDAVNCVLNNNTATNGGAMYKTYAANCVFNNNTADYGGAIYAGSADSCIFKTKNDKNMVTEFFNPTLRVLNFIFTYNSGGILRFNLTSHSGEAINNRQIAIEMYKDNVLVATFSCLSGEGLAIDLDAGKYDMVGYPVDFNATQANETIIINPLSSKITVSSTTLFYDSQYLTVTLRDSNNNPIKGATISVNLNGLKKLTTDSNGQAKLPTGSLAPGTYYVTVRFDGTGNYLSSAVDSRVVVKKATLKLAAKKKTFRKSVKIKKYSVTLKTNQKKPVKNLKVTIKINKKKFTAKTNRKGVATFRISKLTKKGTYKSVVTFKGNKYYNKVSKKVKIKVK